MKQQLFRSKELNESYKTTGAIKIPFVGKDEITELRKLFFQYCPQASHSAGEVFYSMFANSTSQNLQLAERIKEILLPAYNNVFVNYRTFFEMFLVKQFDKSPLLLHQDWSYAEEREVLTATVWLPLQKTTKENGTLFFIPHTHRLFGSYRSGSLPSARIPLSASLAKHVATMETTEGEAIVFHQAVFHGSYPNLSKEDRITVASVVLPDAEEPHYFQYDSNAATLNTYELNEHEFFEHLPRLSKGEIFEGARLLATKPYVYPHLSEQKILDGLESEVKHAV